MLFVLTFCNPFSVSSKGHFVHSFCVSLYLFKEGSSVLAFGAVWLMSTMLATMLGTMLVLTFNV